jgi:hypothetical protein
MDVFRGRAVCRADSAPIQRAILQRSTPGDGFQLADAFLQIGQFDARDGGGAVGSGRRHGSVLQVQFAF